MFKQTTIDENRFGIEPVARMARLRCRICAVGIFNAARTYVESKKSLWNEGGATLSCIVKHFRARQPGLWVALPP